MNVYPATIFFKGADCAVTGFEMPEEGATTKVTNETLALNHLLMTADVTK